MVSQGLSRKGRDSSYTSRPSSSGGRVAVVMWLREEAIGSSQLKPPSSDLAMGMAAMTEEPMALPMVNSSTSRDMAAA